MSTAFVLSGDIEFPQALRRLQRQAALVRALVDEIDRATPDAVGARGVPRYLSLGAQFVEEFGRLGCGMLECAVAQASARPGPPPDVAKNPFGRLGAAAKRDRPSQPA